MLALLVRYTLELAAAVIFPAPVCVQVPLVRVRVPPLVASSVPVLVLVQVEQVSGLMFRFTPLMLALIVPELTKFNCPLPTVPPPVIFEEVVRTEPLVPKRYPVYCPLLLVRLMVPLPLRVRLFSIFSPVVLPDALKVMVPPLLMLPPTNTWELFSIVTESPVLPRVSVPMVKSSLLPMVVGAEAVLMAMFSPVVIAPLFQLLASLQSVLPEPPPPVQVSVVTGGCPLDFALRADTSGCALKSDCCESLCFDPAAACAETGLLKLKKAARRHRTEVDTVTAREDAGRMRCSIRTDSVRPIRN